MKRVGIDTNMLLRLIVNDDPEQRQIVTSFGAKLNQEYRGVVTARQSDRDGLGAAQPVRLRPPAKH